ncbi:hypothetical protein KKE74_01730 [Patescibacteria group bacterium]|nr:hypothetical protein [Patescibacteria group bacterium]
MSIVLILFKSIIFWGILFSFGYQLSKYLFKKNYIEVLIALSGLIGLGLYIFLINAIGYFIAIKITFYLVLLIFIIIYGVLYFINKPKKLEWGIDKKWRKILLITVLLLIAITFIIDNRVPLADDQTALSCVPGAATIAEGNFPVMAIWMPQYPLRYHYGSHLLAAAIYKVTDVPLYMSYDVQVSILIGILFLLGFILIKKITENNKKSLIVSFLMLCIGSLYFLKGIKGIFILYNKYILYQDMFAPFKFVLEMVTPLLSRPSYVWMIIFPTNALGFVLIIGIIYLYFSSIKENNKKIILLNSLLLATLALFAETFFAVFCFLIIIYPFVFGLIKKDWLRAKFFLITSLLMLMIAVPIAFIQGGVLTHYLGIDGHDIKLHQAYGYTDIELLKRGFEINKEPWILMTRLGENNRLPIYSPKFLLEWGLLLILIIIAVIYFWKRKSKYIIFLELSFFVLFLIPFFIIFPLESCSTERFFYLANLFGGIIIGLFLFDLYFKKRNLEHKLFKKIIFFIVTVLIAQWMVFQLIFLTIGYPPAKWNNMDKFFVKKNSFEAESYQWVRENTKINDYFLIFNFNNDYIETPNLKFILNTGRIAPVYTYISIEDNPIDIPESYAFKQLQENCDKKLIKYLDYKYFYIDENWPEELKNKCLINNNLELKFESIEGDRFIKIYKIL